MDLPPDRTRTCSTALGCAGLPSRHRLFGESSGYGDCVFAVHRRGLHVVLPPGGNPEPTYAALRQPSALRAGHRQQVRWKFSRILTCSLCKGLCSFRSKYHLLCRSYSRRLQSNGVLTFCLLYAIRINGLQACLHRPSVLFAPGFARSRCIMCTSLQNT